MTVHFIDVGQGLAIMAKAGDDVLVYDGGNSDAASYFVSYLKDEGVEDIDYMIASHYDADHLNGLVGVHFMHLILRQSLHRTINIIPNFIRHFTIHCRLKIRK